MCRIHSPCALIVCGVAADSVQHIGKVIYENTTDDVWLPMAQSIPGLIPRTVEGYERIF